MSPHGGRRRPKPGKAYAQRTDLNTNRAPLPVEAASGQAYGMRKAQEDAQRAVPLSAPPGPPQPTRGAVAPAPLPGELGDPLRATDRPAEFLTSGIDSGPGPGSEALWPAGSPPNGGERFMDELGAIYSRFPSEALREMIEELSG